MSISVCISKLKSVKCEIYKKASIELIGAKKIFTWQFLLWSVVYIFKGLIQASQIDDFLY